MNTFLTSVHRRLVVGAGSALLALSSFAEGEQNITTPKQLMEDVSTKLQGYLTDAFPILAVIIGAGIGIWVVYKLIGLLKRAFSTSGGR